MRRDHHIEIGFQVYAAEGGEAFGAVRGFMPQTNTLVIYIENAGEFVIPVEAIQAVHDAKVIINIARLDTPVRIAIAHAHDREEPGA